MDNCATQWERAIASAPRFSPSALSLIRTVNERGMFGDKQGGRQREGIKENGFFYQTMAEEPFKTCSGGAECVS